MRAAERAGLRDAELGERLLRERVLGRAGLGWILGLGFGPEERAGRAGLLAGFWAGLVWVLGWFWFLGLGFFSYSFYSISNSNKV